MEVELILLLLISTTENDGIGENVVRGDGANALELEGADAAASFGVGWGD